MVTPTPPPKGTMFILACLFALLALAGIVGLIIQLRMFGGVALAVGIIGFVGFFLGSVLWAQDVGEASTLKDWTGNVQGSESTSGLHTKAPWVDVITFNLRNQRVVYTNPKTSTGDNTGGKSDGREIAVVDHEGVNENVDITVRYSINPAQTNTIYRDFKNEEGLKTLLIFNDIRSVTRDQAGTLTTLEVLSDHPKFGDRIKKALEEKWAKYGVSIDEVSIQQTDAPKVVKDAYAAAQKSQIDVQKATNELNATKVSAQQQVVKAQASADANRILSASLTPEILEQKYIDALKAGTVYVVTPGSGAFVNAVK